MKSRLAQRFLIGIVSVLAIILAGSGWVYNAIKDRQSAKSVELSQLNTSFVQQYGTDTIIKQLLSQDKVYTAVWTDKDGVTHVSWNIGGLWVTVYTSIPTIPATP